MDSESKIAAAMTGDTSKAAMARRLRAARIVAGLTQEQLGEVVGVGKSAINNMEKARSYVSLEVMRYFFREHRVDYNFFIAGLYAQLPGDVQDQLFAALTA